MSSARWVAPWDVKTSGPLKLSLKWSQGCGGRFKQNADFERAHEQQGLFSQRYVVNRAALARAGLNTVLTSFVARKDTQDLFSEFDGANTYAVAIGEYLSTAGASGFLRTIEGILSYWDRYKGEQFLDYIQTKDGTNQVKAIQQALRNGQNGLRQKEATWNTVLDQLNERILNSNGSKIYELRTVTEVPNVTMGKVILANMIYAARLGAGVPLLVAGWKTTCAPWST